MLDQVFAQSCLFFPLAMGVYLTYAILKTTDLTVDGSFVLGAGVFARMVTLEIHPLLSIALSLLAGALAGIAVSLIQMKGRIRPLIASILIVFILSSLNLIIMDRPNISLLRSASLFTLLPQMSPVMLIVILTSLLTLGLLILLSSQKGLILRALGENPLLLRLMSIRGERYKLLGLILSNVLAAFSGAMTAQVHGYADINMGFGMALIGIATAAISEELRTYLLPARLINKPVFRLAFCFSAVFFYFLSLNILVGFGFSPLYVKMAIGLFLIIGLGSTGKKEAVYA